ncbi:uncharacterized protein FFUJ_02644 [Fusarium fujikuroi IMI 58289]|uniref:Exo-alpha-sialidase / neuraminidase n=2 Tax=Fusarium fujikuroi TaxID=5127 RepID=S0DSX7_GIBF5|nr:uncharacterized protein FFUJ_02644 [Fusarium fujikuroi IMI 58289]KLP04374.1 uncharacterized protein LW94_3046 [Fusarium fujikuroi]KLP08071.1 uncharacterized protein Y057_11612 [Fusarium fujikuroi]QGI61853.1 hypothetical protein CEK27_005824 [Fusarium fujikuroi]QGI92751.1 hypothetical protein CEK26_005820 [Fusarium fujikuroi]CCT65679.1 uncharacterized protein FFUJ_02644 [Fusarium fujikuroi IMI 58289]
MHGLTLITTGLSLLGPAVAILVADNSPCGTVCGNVLDATTNDDVVCQEGDYTSGAGIVFQQCLTCEQSSDYTTKNNQTDQEYYLYNLRYATSYCLFGIPDNKNTIDTPCLTSKACGPFRNAIVYRNLSSDVEGYDYCDNWPIHDTADFVGCTECLQAGDNHFLANFITVLQAGCEQKPLPGTLVSTEGSIFSRDDVNVTEPTPVASVNPDWLDQGPISLGAKVGIAAGGVAFILFILGFCIIWRGRRRRRAFLSMLETKHNNSWPTPLTIPRETRDTPLSQKPLRSWDESPVSVRSEHLFPHHVSPYASQYNSPVSATELKLAHWPVMAPNQQMTPAMNSQSQFPQMFPSMYQPDPSSSQIGVALGGDDSSVNSGNSKGKGLQGEEYEMTPVDNPHAGIGIYQTGVNPYGESSRTTAPQPGYFPEGFNHMNQSYGYHDPYGHHEDPGRMGRDP